MFRSVNIRPALLWFTISFTFVFSLGGIALLAGFSPALQEKFESIHYRLLELLPPPPHTEFVPTPMPTRSVAQVLGPPSLAKTNPTQVLDPTPTPEPTDAPIETSTSQITATSSPPPTRTPSVPVKPVLAAVQLPGVIQDYQRWNNCGPTTLEMGLSFFGRHDSQSQIASVLKPDPDDKNVSPVELVSYARSTGLNSLVRINGSIDRIKLILSNGLPVIVETGFDPPQAHEGWMGHYRLITGFDAKSFITQDSYDGPNVSIEFSALDGLWRDFNRTYILLYTPGQAPLVRAMLGGDQNDSEMYAAAVAQAQREFRSNPKDAFAEFNLGSSLVGLQRYEEAAAAYDESRLLGLPWRMLWYQFGPYEAYLQVGRYDEVVALADATLKPASDLEESYYYKGLALEKLGQPEQARAQFLLALHYNKNYTDAQLELDQLAQQ
jgi:uncharacterized protein YvpB